ncbi:MAG TPA: hypothetical protein VGW32_05965, partial [Pyrinomonadaceae bacterium]|nr:hypothetical protein [Pyrinomonadaceae bacterium]
LFFACKLCSFSDNTNSPNSNSNSSPSSQSTMYAREFIKPDLGRFSRSKSYTKEELRKTASGFTVKMIEQSGDCAGGEYSGGSGTAALMACSYSGSSAPATLIEEIEGEIKNDRGMQFVRAVPKGSGKRVEATDSQGRGVVAWNNGHWLFMTIGNSLSDTTALADGVGY